MISTEQSLAFRPIFSETFELNASSPLFLKGIFIFRITDEERTNLTPVYLNPNNPNLIQVIDESEDTFTYIISGKELTVSIVDEEQVSNFLLSIRREEQLYIDITGLSHHIWAILIKISFIHNINLKVLYAEPMYPPREVALI